MYVCRCACLYVCIIHASNQACGRIYSRVLDVCIRMSWKLIRPNFTLHTYACVYVCMYIYSESALTDPPHATITTLAPQKTSGGMQVGTSFACQLINFSMKAKRVSKACAQKKLALPTGWLTSSEEAKVSAQKKLITHLRKLRANVTWRARSKAHVRSRVCVCDN